MEKMFKSFPRYEAQTSGEEINSNDYYNLVKVISSETELSEVDVDNAIKHVINQKQGRCSIDDIVENSEDEFGIHHNLIVDEATLFQELYEKETLQKIKEILSILSDREKRVIMLRNGIETQRPLTLEEIGSILGVTRERVRQIEDKALRRLRLHISRHYKHLYLNEE